MTDDSPQAMRERHDGEIVNVCEVIEHLKMWNVLDDQLSEGDSTSALRLRQYRRFLSIAIAERLALAENIHYPGCWDTLAAYPTLTSALLEITRCNAFWPYKLARTVYGELEYQKK